MQNFLQRLKRFAHTKLFRFLVLPILILVLIGSILSTFESFIFPKVAKPQFGVSFSVMRAEELGLDWRKNFTALLDDMQIKHYRLMSYWDRHEISRGEYNFDELDWQLNEVAKRGGTVSLSIGLRQPRWPECHPPAWLGSLPQSEQDAALLNYIRTVISRYENNPVVASWQLENEAVNSWFGECKTPNRALINQETKLVKELSHKKLFMSLSDQHGLPVFGERPDAYGFSVYRRVWINATNSYATYPTPIWFHRLRAATITLTTGKPIFIHELQLEPWGPTDTKDLSPAEQARSMSIDQIGKNIEFGRRIGSDEIYLWGGEWWYWYREHYDSSVWDTVKEQLRAA